MIKKTLMILLFLSVSSSPLWAKDSTRMPIPTHRTASTHSYMLEAGKSDLVRGSDQRIGTTNSQCPAGTHPLATTSIRDTDTTHCSMTSLHARDPYVKPNVAGGYDVFIGYINASIQVCNDQGVSVNWVVTCMKG